MDRLDLRLRIDTRLLRLVTHVLDAVDAHEYREVDRLRKLTVEYLMTEKRLTEQEATLMLDPILSFFLRFN